MKKIFFTLILFFLTISAHAADNSWTATDTTLQVTYLTLHSMDWAQTLHIARNPERHSEINNILGRHPSEGRVNSYFALTAIATTGLSYVLPKPWRTGWQVGIIVTEYSWVQHNRRAGIGISFHF